MTVVSSTARSCVEEEVVACGCGGGMTLFSIPQEATRESAIKQKLQQPSSVYNSAQLTSPLNNNIARNNTRYIEQQYLCLFSLYLFFQLIIITTLLNNKYSYVRAWYTFIVSGAASSVCCRHCTTTTSHCWGMRRNHHGDSRLTRV